MKLNSYSIFINIIILIRNLRWAEEVKETFTLFSFSNWLGIFGSLLWLLFKNLLCQTFSWKPLNLRPKNNKSHIGRNKILNNFLSRDIFVISKYLPNCLLQDRFIFINHVISFCQNRILEEWISVEIKVKLEAFWVFYSGPFNISEEFESPLISLRNLGTIKYKK